MTAIFRSRRDSGSSRRRHTGDPEERFTTWVTIGFIALIVAVIAIVLIAVGFNYWEQHFKAVATVRGVGITRDQWTDRARVEAFRLDLRYNEIGTALAAGELTPDDAAALRATISDAQRKVASTAIEDLIDLTYQGQLAADRGLSVTDADVDAAIGTDSAPPERRHISVIFVDPAAGKTVGTTPDDLQDAYLKAQQAAADLAGGKAFDEVARQYSTDATKDKGGDYGTVGRDATLDATLLSALFALPLDGTTPVIAGSDGVYRIGRVTAIKPGEPDPSFQATVSAEISWDLYRSNVRMEALADALRKSVVADASADAEQVHLEEIFLSGDPTADPATDFGQVRASHILYSPNDDPGGAAGLAPDDPAWATAKEEATRAATQLRSVVDVAARTTAFVARAKAQSDDTGSGANGGDLGFFTKDRMVPEFANAVFDDPKLVAGDIVGPVKTEFGWHVILFADRISPLKARLDDAQKQLVATGADFGAIAREVSDGAEASVNGDLGWRTKDQLDPLAATALAALQPGATSEPVALGDGYHIYRLVEKATRPLDAQQLATVQSGAFAKWYDPQKAAAVKGKAITRDSSAFTASTTGLASGRASL